MAPIAIIQFLQTLLSPLIALLDLVITTLHAIGLSWGLAIIALTMIVRLILLPLTIKQFRSMQALTDLAPQIRDLNEKYKDDQDKLREETIKFYADNKVNPFASCLPIAFQIPVFIALFYMLLGPLKIDICGPESKILAVGKAANPPTDLANTYCQAVDPGSAQFLFIPDLTAPTSGTVLIVLLVLYVISQLLSSLLTVNKSSDWRSRAIFIVLPFFFVFFIKGFAAGLILYWITTNLWTVGQQFFLLRANNQLPTWLGGPEPVLVPEASETSEAVAVKPPPPSPRKKKKRSGRRKSESQRKKQSD